MSGFILRGKEIEVRGFLESAALLLGILTIPAGFVLCGLIAKGSKNHD